VILLPVGNFLVLLVGLYGVLHKKEEYIEVSEFTGVILTSDITKKNVWSGAFLENARHPSYSPSKEQTWVTNP
jgi:hypothetical protein